MKNKNIMKIMCATVLAGIITVSTCGFTHNDVYAKNTTELTKQTFTINDVTKTTNDFIKIEKKLCYDPKTNIVWMEYMGYEYTYTPYIAPNGLPYKYDPQTNTFYMITPEDYAGKTPAKGK